MTNYVYIATSLDGFIATENGGLDWLEDISNPAQDDFGFAEFMSGIDAVVMGRNTFEQVLTFGEWPYDKPVFVLSSSLTELPLSLYDEVEIIGGDPDDVVERLNAEGYMDLYIDGGKTIQGFLQQDLIDEMIITRVPVILGSGIPLFGNAGDRLHFRHKETTVYNNYLVKSHYIRDRAFS